MTQITAVTGQAGTGKTTWLMRKATELAARFLVADHDSILAITRMHGSRRRIAASACGQAGRLVSVAPVQRHDD